MMRRIVFSTLLLTCASASGIASDPPKYTPAIHGRLLSGGRPVTSNVCLRRSDSEVRACGYTDFDGRFYIPYSGPLVPDTSEERKEPAPRFPAYWLEYGRIGAAKRLAPVDLVDDRHSTITLDCDLGHAARSGDDPGLCRTDAGVPSKPDRVARAAPASHPRK
jgi:hypothetical protein